MCIILQKGVDKTLKSGIMLCISKNVCKNRKGESTMKQQKNTRGHPVRGGLLCFVGCI
mgnify:CR=1 FL=1